jgi:AcrR family transcriptional regulator
MTESAARLMGARGLRGTSFADVLVDSGAPRGSIYHHFPRGKEQLAIEAIRWTSDQIRAHMQLAPSGPPEAVLAYFVDFWRASVAASGGAVGCPVTGVAVDTPAGAEIMATVREAFGSWAQLLQDQLETAGVARERAASLSLTALACMEGALILCRAEESTAPLESVSGELARLLGDANAPPATTRR